MARRRRMERPRGVGWRDWWARRGEGGMVGCCAGDGLGEARAARRAQRCAQQGDFSSIM
jgi:putative component of toxin-antitoxin plasmid stabilization module